MPTDLPSNFFQLALIASIWTIPWKGLALWKAVKNNHKGWFIFILIISTIGIVEIIYLFLIPPRTKFTFTWSNKNK